MKALMEGMLLYVALPIGAAVCGALGAVAGDPAATTGTRLLAALGAAAYLALAAGALSRSVRDAARADARDG